MPIILQEKKSNNIQLEPKNINQIKQKLYNFDNVWKQSNNIRKDIPGVQQAKHVVRTDYNTDNKNKQEGQITQLEAERIINHDKVDKNGQSIFHQLFDADTMTDIKSKVKQARTKQKPTLPQKDNNKTATKISVPNVKAVQPQKPNSVAEGIIYQSPKTIFINENQLKILKEYQDN